MDDEMAELQRVYESFGPVVWAYLRRRMSIASDAEELLQETFLVVVHDPAALQSADSQRAWLIGVARNLLRRYARKRSRQTVRSLSDDPPERRGPEPDPRLEPMRKAIKELPEAQRETIELRLGQELSYAEIAEALGVPIGTVRSRLHNGILALRMKLSPAAEQAR